MNRGKKMAIILWRDTFWRLGAPTPSSLNAGLSSDNNNNNNDLFIQTHQTDANIGIGLFFVVTYIACGKVGLWTVEIERFA